MKNSFKRSSAIFCLSIATFFCLLLSPTIVMAAIDPNAAGVPNGVVGTGGGGKINGDYAFGITAGAKVNLVKLTDTSIDWVTFYFLLDNISSRNEYNRFMSDSNVAGGVVGQIYSDRYETAMAYAADVRTLNGTNGIGVDNIFFLSGGGLVGPSFDSSRLKSSMVDGSGNGTDTFYKVLYALFTTTKQGNASASVPSIRTNMANIHSWSELKTSMTDHPELWTDLADYRIIFEPIYRWQNRSIGKNLYTTHKAGASLKREGSNPKLGGVYTSPYLENCRVERDDGVIKKDTSGSLDSATRLTSGYGYAIFKIVNEVKTCDPTKSCCYSEDGTYNAMPPNPPENETTFRCVGTVNEDKTCSVPVTSCNIPDEVLYCPEGTYGVEGKGDGTDRTFNNYYLFSLSNDDAQGAKGKTFTNTGANDVFKDTEIFQSIIDSRFSGDTTKTIENSIEIVKVDGKIGKVMPLGNSNIDEFYTHLRKAINDSKPDFYFKEGAGDYYIWHHHYTGADGVVHYQDDLTIGEVSSLKSKTVFAEEIRITPHKTAEGGYNFSVTRKMPSEISITGTLLSPAEYRISYCIKQDEIEEPNCDDEVNQAVCGTGGTKPIFHESDDLKTCTIKKDNHSGFVAIDQTSDIDQTEEDTSKYCTMACKEDLDIELPGEKETAAGQYFKLDNYTPKISAKRTCVTTEIKYSDFDNDLKVIEPDIPKKFNKWHDHYEIAEHLNGGQASATAATNKAQSEASTKTNTEYNVERKTCTIATSRLEEYCKTEKKVAESDTEAMNKCKEENKNHTEEYLLETYKANGKDYKYVTAGGIYCNDDERSGYGAVKNSSGSWNALSNDTSLSEDKQALSYEDRTKKTYTEKLIEAHKNKPITSTNSSEVGEITDSGSGSCTITSADGKSKSEYHYTYESWIIYSYTPALSGETGVTYAGRSGTYISNTKCGDSDPTYAKAVQEEFNHESGLAAAASSDYYQTLKKYQETINNYNRCFNWNDTTKDQNLNYFEFTWNSVGALKPFDQNGRYDDYNYEFEPSVSYWYEDPDGAIFPVTYDYDYNKDSDEGPRNGYGYVEKSGFQTEMSYWKGTDPGEKYDSGGTKKSVSFPSKGENSEDRNLITCDPDAAKCTRTDVTATPFYRSSYLKRIESVSYTYHLPRVISSIPDGKVHLRSGYTGTKPFVKLDLEASPVNINTRAGTYDYKFTVTKLKDDLRARKSSGSVEYNDIEDHRPRTVSGDNTNPDDDYEDRFDNGNGTTTDPVLDVAGGTDYICHYRVINDIYIPDDSKLNFFYRIIDPANINPTGRPLGYNWTDTRATKSGDGVIDRMKDNEDDYQELIDEDNGTFEFTLTPLIMKQIRAYNAKQTNSGGYADWDLECHDYEDESGNLDSQGYHCYSTFLTCLSSKGNPGDGSLNCQGIFGSSLNASNYNPEYDLEKLRQNRENLLTKQKALDCSNDNAFLNKACGG